VRQAIAAAAVLLAFSGGIAVAQPTRAATKTGHAHAVAEDKRILAAAPVLPGALRSATAPDSSLKEPPEYPSVDGLVTRAHYWTAKESFTKAFKTLAAKPPPGFSVFTTIGGAKYGEEATDDSANHLPTGIGYGHLLIQVIPTGKHRSAIGVYAEAAPAPRRPADEHVPASARSVALGWSVTEDSQPLHRTMTGRAATKLVKDFDAMTVSLPGESVCGLSSGSQSATFTAAGHTWIATANACPWISVTRDGHHLRDLNESSAYAADLLRDLGGKPGQMPTTEQVPSSLRRVQLTQQQPPSDVVVPKTVVGSQAASLVNELDRLQTVHRAHLRCRAATGRLTTATFTVGSNTWVAHEDTCGLLSVKRNGTSLRPLVSNDFWESDLSRVFAS
jgi:hypothetical protein